MTTPTTWQTATRVAVIVTSVLVLFAPPSARPYLWNLWSVCMLLMFVIMVRDGLRSGHLRMRPGQLHKEAQAGRLPVHPLDLPIIVLILLVTLQGR